MEIATCIKTINNTLLYSIRDIHNNIIHEVSEGMQDMSQMTYKE